CREVATGRSLFDSKTTSLNLMIHASPSRSCRFRLHSSSHFDPCALSALSNLGILRPSRWNARDQTCFGISLDQLCDGVSIRLPLHESFAASILSRRGGVVGPVDVSLYGDGYLMARLWHHCGRRLSFELPSDGGMAFWPCDCDGGGRRRQCQLDANHA